MKKILLSATLLVTLGATNAQAQTIGDRLQAIVGDIWDPFFILAAVLSGIAGLFFAVKGFMKLAEAAQNGGGGRSSYGTGLIYIAVAAMLISLPDAAGVGMQSVLGAARGGATLGSGALDYSDEGISGSFMERIAGPLASVGETENCLTSEQPATCMARNVAKNVVPMAVMALFAIVFIIGFISFASAIMEIARSSERGDQKGGHITKIITSVLLMNSPLFFTQVTKTMLGSIDSPITNDGLNVSSALLRYPTGSDIQVVQNYVELIGHSFTILAFFGAWAFVRGIFMVKGVAEAGRQAGSYGMAATYMIAGILMANSKFSSCLVLTSFGGPNMGAGFCA